MVVIKCLFCDNHLQIDPDGPVLRDRCQCGAQFFIEPELDSQQMELIENVFVPGQRVLPVMRQDGSSFSVVFY